MYALILAGGKQHRVQPGDLIQVESMAEEVGSQVHLDRVLLVGGDSLQVGHPWVPGARVEAEVIRHGRSQKILVYKKKRRKNYQRKRGHRQHFTQLRVKNIVVG